jgi:hypothetical protein
VVGRCDVDRDAVRLAALRWRRLFAPYGLPLSPGAFYTPTVLGRRPVRRIRAPDATIIGAPQPAKDISPEEDL